MISDFSNLFAIELFVVDLAPYASSIPDLSIDFSPLLVSYSLGRDYVGELVSPISQQFYDFCLRQMDSIGTSVLDCRDSLLFFASSVFNETSSIVS